MAGKFPTHKWIDQKACSDFLAPSQADLRQYFGKDSQSYSQERICSVLLELMALYRVILVVWKQRRSCWHLSKMHLRYNHSRYKNFIK
jgi:hypothetical protein